MAIYDFTPDVIGTLPFWKWNKVLPAVYDDSLSQYELLCKLLYKVNEIITSSNSTGEQVKKLTNLVQQLIDGEFPADLVTYVQEVAAATAQEETQSISDAVNALATEVDYKMPRLNDPNTKIVSVGDSWNAGVCDGQLTGYDIANGWSRRIMSMIGRDTSSNYANYAQPSAGFVVKGGSAERNFLDMLNQASDTTDSTIIIVAGGINDANALEAGTITIADIQSAAQSFCNTAMKKFTNAIIYVFPMLWSGHSTLRNADVRTKNAIILGCRRSNAMVSICEHTPEFLFGQSAFFGSGTQGHHTTLDGLYEVARYMKEFICGGDSHYHYWSNLRNTSVTNAINFSTLDVTVDNGTLNVHVYGTLNDNFDSTNVPLLSLRDGNTFFGNRIPMHVLAAIGGNQAPILCRVYEDEIYLSSRLASTPVSGNNIYIDFSMPFAF